MYYFVIKVVEGPAGVRVTDAYTSDMFDTLEDCKAALNIFDPNQKWKHLRDVRYRRIYCSGSGHFVPV